MEQTQDMKVAEIVEYYADNFTESSRTEELVVTGVPIQGQTTELGTYYRVPTATFQKDSVHSRESSVIVYMDGMEVKSLQRSNR